ncbi:MAG: hypothetical protein J3Q66DRAFT_387022 [Benniella sp.]|nr:MAG: hypothetical protein J3Q66DRAFT_387022 [Benniella sp.]
MAAHEHRAQGFRCEPSTKITSIPTRFDNKTGQHIVLWRDIQHLFTDAKAIFNKGEAVLFLTDDNFDYLTPLRIPHYPGVVLEVVGTNAPEDTTITFNDQADISIQATLQEPRMQDCMSPPFAGKSLHMELSTLSLLETTDGDDACLPCTTMSADVESVLQDEQSEDNKAISAKVTDSPLQMATVFETPEDLKDEVQTPCEITDIGNDSLSQQEDPSNNDNSDAGSMEDIVVQSDSMAIYTDSSIRAYRRLHKSYVRAVNGGRSTRATAIECAMIELFDKLETEMGKIRDIHQQLVQTHDGQIGENDIQQKAVEEEHQFDHTHVVMEEQCQQSPSPQQNVEEKLETEKQQLSFRQQPTGDEQEQDHSVHLQGHSPSDRLPDIHEHIMAMLNQNYELHEYPHPRLFIVLPKEVHGPDKIVKPLAGQFRLYFLCDCGAHTMPRDSPTFHQVHLAAHKGYDIVKPVEFFDKYGRYVLMQMYMIKHGIRVAGLAVPSLENSKIAQGLDMKQEQLDSLVNANIRFLQDLVRGKIANSMRLDKIEVVDRGEKGQLGRYLEVKDADHGFGNLYRSITRHGHVRWACKDHYIANNPDSIMEEIKTDAENYFRPDMRELRRQCYVRFDTLRNSGGYDVNIRSIQLLRITILYNSYYGDPLPQLPGILISTNIMDLALDGSGYSCKQYEFDLIMKSMSNGRLRSLRFLSYQDIAYATTINSIVNAPMMRVLELQSPIDAESEVGMSYIQRILTCCRNLVYLGLRLKEQVSLVKVITTVIPKLKKLERLELYYSRFYTIADLTHCNIKSIQMYLPFIKHHLFEGAKLPYYAEDLDETLALDQLAEILYKKPAINDIKFGYRELDHLDIINAVLATRQATFPKGDGMSLPMKLELISLWNHQHALSTSIIMEFAESGIETEVRISEWEQPDCAMYIDFFRDYAWSITTLDMMNGVIDDSLAQLLDKSTKGKGIEIKSLTLDLKSLSLVGVQSIDQVIRRSQGLGRLVVICAASDFEHEKEKTQWFLEQYGKKLTGLYLQGPDPETLTPWLKQVFPSRQVLPILSDLQLRFRGSPTFQQSSPFIQWLVGMISALHKPTHNSTTSSVMGTSPMGCSDGSSTTNEVWLPLQRLYLNYFKPYQYWSGGWGTILEVIDFSALEELDLKGASFESIDVQLLVDYIGRADGDVPLKSLDLSGTSLSKVETENFYKAPFEALRKKAPSVKIVGLSHRGVN